jgi:hypothetical protein
VQANKAFFNSFFNDSAVLLFLFHFISCCDLCCCLGSRIPFYNSFHPFHISKSLILLLHPKKEQFRKFLFLLSSKIRAELTLPTHQPWQFLDSFWPLPGSKDYDVFFGSILDMWCVAELESFGPIFHPSHTKISLELALPTHQHHYPIRRLTVIQFPNNGINCFTFEGPSADFDHMPQHKRGGGNCSVHSESDIVTNSSKSFWDKSVSYSAK